MKSVTELLNSASNVKLPSVASMATGRGIMSFGLVNSEGNGKRFTLTKSLINANRIDKKVALLPIPEEGVLLLAEKLPFENAIEKTLKLKGEARLSYAAPVVALLTECFKLNFGTHVSMSFQDITIDKLPDGSPLAIVNMQNPKSYAGAREEGDHSVVEEADE